MMAILFMMVKITLLHIMIQFEAKEELGLH